MIYRQNVLCGPRCQLDGNMAISIGTYNLMGTARDCGQNSNLGCRSCMQVVTPHTTFKVLPDKGLGER